MSEPIAKIKDAKGTAFEIVSEGSLGTSVKLRTTHRKTNRMRYNLLTWSRALRQRPNEAIAFGLEVVPESIHYPRLTVTRQEDKPTNG
jgi:hypothetical protein